MLAKANRIVRGADYRNTVRRGTRISARNTVTYVRRVPDVGSIRFGFIVGKPVGVAVTRNLVRRRLKAICSEMLPTMTLVHETTGLDIVIRALPASAQVPWATLREEIFRVVDKVGAR